MAIELKEMSQYPVLESPHTVSNPVVPPPNDPSASAPRTLPQYLTPIVPIASNPPPMSFVEQQRLRAQEARPEERKDYPSLPPQPQRVSMPPQNPMPYQGNAYLSIACSGCRGIIQYPPNVPIVYCLQCRASTATKPLLNIFCQYCRTTSYYMAENTHVRCRCGTLYAISQVPA